MGYPNTSAEWHEFCKKEMDTETLTRAKQEVAYLMSSQRGYEVAKGSVELFNDPVLRMYPKLRTDYLRVVPIPCDLHTVRNDLTPDLPTGFWLWGDFFLALYRITWNARTFNATVDSMITASEKMEGIFFSLLLQRVMKMAEPPSAASSKALIDLMARVRAAESTVLRPFQGTRKRPISVVRVVAESEAAFRRSRVPVPTFDPSPVAPCPLTPRDAGLTRKLCESQIEVPKGAKELPQHPPGIRFTRPSRVRVQGLLEDLAVRDPEAAGHVIGTVAALLGTDISENGTVELNIDVMPDLLLKWVVEVCEGRETGPIVYDEVDDF